MTILVTGGSGQVALALEAAAGDLPVRRIGRPEFNYDRPETIGASVEAYRPTLVINAAAYTAVDQAETDSDAAQRANAEGPGILAQACARARVPLIHISTDYVFDGSKAAPYKETDPTAPLGVYGTTKLAGEQAARAANSRTVVLRTSWVISHTGKNFVRTMVNAGRKTDSLRVVGDQRGCPTSAADLAAAILQVARRMQDGWDDRYAGLFHAAGGGETTWHGLAEAVFEDAERHGLRRPTVTPITIADWPTPVKRPADSRLDCDKLRTVFGAQLPDWRASVTRIVDLIFAT
jgi:dTDP-4-dehydrorhamnose reductase